MTALYTTPQTQHLTTFAKKLGLHGVVRKGGRHFYFQNAVHGWRLAKTTAGAEARLRELRDELNPETPPKAFLTGATDVPGRDG